MQRNNQTHGEYIKIMKEVKMAHCAYKSMYKKLKKMINYIFSHGFNQNLSFGWINMIYCQRVNQIGYMNGHTTMILQKL